MTFSLGQNSEREKLRKEMRTHIVGRTIGFAATVTEWFDVSFEQSDEPSYSRMFSIGPPKSGRTHLNEMLLGLGALCFFVHALDRLSFRPNSEALREAIFDTTAAELAGWFGEMLGKYA